MAEALQPTGETATDFNRMNPYGPGAAADDTRQAQQTQSNDTPTDVNCNAVIAREQAATLTLMGKNFESNANFLHAMQNRFLKSVT
jgi:hypothetical protein